MTFNRPFYAAFAVLIAFSFGVTSVWAELPYVLHDSVEGRVSFHNLDNLLSPDPVTLSLSARSENMLPENALAITGAGLPEVITNLATNPSVTDDIDGDPIDVVVNVYEETTLTWHFPSSQGLHSLREIEAGNIVAPGAKIDYFTYRGTIQTTFLGFTGQSPIIGIGQIRIVPEPSTAALLLCYVVPAVVRRRR